MTKRAAETKDDPASELFYEDESGQRQDADIQEPMLAEGDEAACVAATRARLAADGYDAATLDLLFGTAND